MSASDEWLKKLYERMAEFVMQEAGDDFPGRIFGFGIGVAWDESGPRLEEGNTDLKFTLYIEEGEWTEEEKQELIKKFTEKFIQTAEIDQPEAL